MIEVDGEQDNVREDFDDPGLVFEGKLIEGSLDVSQMRADMQRVLNTLNNRLHLAPNKFFFIP